MRRSRSRTCDGTALTDWDTDAIKPALLLTHTESQDTHDFFHDASADEVAASSAYTAGCVTLGSKTATYDTASDQTRLDAGVDELDEQRRGGRRPQVDGDRVDVAAGIGYVDFGGASRPRTALSRSPGT
jgi:hypothetical protein